MPGKLRINKTYVRTGVRRRRPPPIRPPRRGCGRLKGRLGALGLLIAMVIVLLWFIGAASYYVWALTFDLRQINEIPQRSAVYAADGDFYSRLAGENRVIAPFDKISNDFVNALITREDTRFYSHRGVDPIGIGRAIVRNLLVGGLREGASTITQQLARNSFSLGGRNLHRKVIEAALAFRIETELTKEQILECYMNRIYFGSGFYGIETASRGYFGKPASRLTLSEAATLAGLIRSPNRFSPFNNLAAAKRERNTVLERMRAIGLISTARLVAALEESLRVRERPPSSYRENWAIETIEEELDLVIDRRVLEQGGLKIYTTVVPALQRAAERAVADGIDAVERRPGFSYQTRSDDPPQRAFASEYLQGALVAVDNRTGGIRAIAGSRNLKESRFNRAYHAIRQAGSTVKPFVYACAFERGLEPNAPVSDGPLTSADIPDDYGRYSPANADGTYRGVLPAREGLILSRNTMSVRVGMRAGLDAVADGLVRAGLAADVPRYPSLFLGAFETNLRDLTAAYTAFSAGGIKLQPFIIDRIVDADGRTIYKATRGRVRLFTARTAEATSEILEQVVARGTAARARAYGIRGRIAGKTGTTNDSVDAWFVGFNRLLTCGVWVGFDRPRQILPGSGGSDLALPIWANFMRSASP